jgi:hypothetical protein
MARMVRHLITYRATIYGTVEVTCDECEHHPEKLAFDAVEWDLSSVEDLEVVDGDIIDSWEEQDAEVLDEPAPDLAGDDEIPF